MRGNEKTPPINPKKMTKFEAGQTYRCRMTGNDSTFDCTVLKRTKSFATIKSVFGESRRKVYVYDGEECLDPTGQYALSPVLRASKKVAV